MDDFFNFNENMDTGNQNPATEQVGTVDIIPKTMI